MLPEPSPGQQPGLPLGSPALLRVALVAAGGGATLPCSFLQEPTAGQKWASSHAYITLQQHFECCRWTWCLGGCRRRQRCSAGPCRSPCAA